VSILGVWRVTHLLAAEDGPWDVLVRVRRALGASLLGKLMDCFQCASLWVALPFAIALGTTTGSRAALWPALSGAAILLERLTQARATAAPVPYFEGDRENEDGMLRK
jgi:hypothetical protein